MSKEDEEYLSLSFNMTPLESIDNYRNLSLNHDHCNLDRSGRVPRTGRRGRYRWPLDYGKYARITTAATLAIILLLVIAAVIGISFILKNVVSNRPEIIQCAADDKTNTTPAVTSTGTNQFPVIFVIGGTAPEPQQTHVLRYSLSGSDVIYVGQASDLPHAWDYGDTALYNGGIYIVGGTTDIDLNLRYKTVAKYNTIDNDWQILPHMLSNRTRYPCSYVLNDRLYVAGGDDLANGWGGNSPLDGVESLDLLNIEEGWRGEKKLPHQVVWANCVTVRGNVYMSGGKMVDAQPMSQLIQWSSRDDHWLTLAAMSTGHAGHCMVTDGYDHIWVVGGRRGSESPEHDVEVYTISANRWSSVSPMPVNLYAHDCVYNKGRIYVTGGYNQISKADENGILIYTVATNSWANSPTKLAYPVRHHKMAVL